MVAAEALAAKRARVEAENCMAGEVEGVRLFLLSYLMMGVDG